MTDENEESRTPHYPQVTVPMTGEDGNAFFIIGRVGGALRAEGIPDEKIQEFTAQATSGDYDNVLQTVMRWVNVT